MDKKVMEFHTNDDSQGLSWAVADVTAKELNKQNERLNLKLVKRDTEIIELKAQVKILMRVIKES